MKSTALRCAVLFLSLAVIGGWAAVEEVHLALLHLYAAAVRMVKDPGYDYFPKESPAFPYTTDVQAQWRMSESAASNQLSQEDRKILNECAVKLNAAIDYAERGYDLQVKQPNNPEKVQEGKDYVAKAGEKLYLAPQDRVRIW